MDTKNNVDFSFEDKSHVAAIDKGSLKRLLGVKQLFSIGYGDVGSSIYYALGVTTVYALGATPLVLMIAGIFFIFTTLTYAELSSAIPVSGGSQIFARRAFNDLASFIAGWALLLDYVITAAISAYTIGPYLSYFFPTLKDIPVTNIVFAVSIISTLAFLNIKGIKESATISVILAFFDIAMRLIIIVVGLATVFSISKIIEQMGNIGVSPSWSDIVYSIPIAMVAYIGIEAVSQMSGEANEPSKKVPQAMLLTMFAVLIMYAGLSLVAFSSISPQELSTTWRENPLAGVVANIPIVGEYILPLVAIVGGIILFIATNASIIGASRLSYSMSSNYQLPSLFNNLHSRYKTPYISIIVFSTVAVVIVLIGKDLDSLVKLYSFGAMLAFSMAHLSLIGLRIREPDLERPFRLKGNIPIMGRKIPITAILGFLATFAAWLLVIAKHPAARYLGFLWLAIGIVTYLIFRKKGKLPMVKSVDIEKIEMPDYHKLALKKILVPTRGGDTETVQVSSRLARDYGAEIIALHVMEIPPSLPLDDFWAEPWYKGNQALTRASAIAREYGLGITTKLLQSRSAAQTIVEVAKEEGCDLIVLGAAAKVASGIELTPTLSYILKNSPCRVWICSFGSVPRVSDVASDKGKWVTQVVVKWEGEQQAGGGATSNKPV